jgi:hypothetical protein
MARLIPATDNILTGKCPQRLRASSALACGSSRIPQTIENHVISLRALGLQLIARADRRFEDRVTSLPGCATALMPAVLRTLRYDDGAGLACAPFLTSYTVRLPGTKAQARGAFVRAFSAPGTCIIQVRAARAHVSTRH